MKGVILKSSPSRKHFIFSDWPQTTSACPFQRLLGGRAFTQFESRSTPMCPLRCTATPVFHNTRLEIIMKKRILAASLAVLALTACAPTPRTPSEEARRTRLILFHGTKLDAREQLLKKEGSPVATSRVTRLKLSGRVRTAQLQLPMHTHGRYKTKGETKK